MKKSLLNLTLFLVFSNVAYADNSVVIYGQIDAGLGYSHTSMRYDSLVNNSSQQHTDRHSNYGMMGNQRDASYLGLKGSEYLGQGLSAIFQLESGFNPSNGASEPIFFNRKSVVGFANPTWGQITMGRQANPADDFIAPLDPFATSWAAAGANTTFGNALSNTYNTSFKYTTPRFHGLQISWIVYGKSKPNNDTVPKLNRGAGIGFSYTRQALEIAGSFDYEHSTLQSSHHLFNQVVVGKAIHAKSWNLGIRYDFDFLKLHGVIGQQRDGVIGQGQDLAWNSYFSTLNQWKNIPVSDAQNALYSKGYHQTSWLVGITIPLADQANILLSYVGSHAKHNHLSYTNTDLAYHLNSQQANIGVEYQLSKHTAIYTLASWRQATLKQKLAGQTSRLRATEQYYGLGLNHQF